MILALILAGCGHESSDRPERRAAAPESAPPIESRSGERSQSGPLSKNRLTGEYLAGTWCFARPDGEGERGIYVFEPDGSHRVGFAAANYNLELPGDLDTFRERYDELREMEPNRFVLTSGYYPYEFRRGPCP